MGMQNFGEQTKSIMLFLKMAYSPPDRSSWLVRCVFPIQTPWRYSRELFLSNIALFTCARVHDLRKDKSKISLITSCGLNWEKNIQAKKVYSTMHNLKGILANLVRNFYQPILLTNGIYPLSGYFAIIRTNMTIERCTGIILQTNPIPNRPLA